MAADAEPARAATRRSGMRRLAALLPLLLLTACGDAVSPGAGGATTAPPSSSSAGSYAAAGVVLRVTTEGGLAPDHRAGELPSWTLYGDGRVLTQGPQIAIYPGPAWPNVLVQKVSTATVDRIVAAAIEAGVDAKQRDYGNPAVADAVTTVFRLSAESGTYTTKVYALAEGEGAVGTTAEQRAARKELADLANHLTDLNGWLGAGTASEEEPYEPSSVAIFARSYVKRPDEQVAEQKVAWRGPDPKAGTDSPAGRCTVLSGEPLAKVRKDLQGSNTLTRWQTPGGDWSFRIRPLLPEERTCEDLA